MLELWYLPIPSDLAGSLVKIQFPDSLDGVNIQFSKGKIYPVWDMFLIIS